jgi:hypothetical protein
VDTFHYYAVSPDVAARLSSDAFWVWPDEPPAEALTRSATATERFVVVAARGNQAPEEGTELGTFNGLSSKDPPKPPPLTAGESLDSYRARFEIIVPPKGFRG